MLTMSRVDYSAIAVHENELYYIIADINRCQYKIIAVTQNGKCYTIFYERNGTRKRGADNG